MHLAFGTLWTETAVAPITVNIRRSAFRPHMSPEAKTSGKNIVTSVSSHTLMQIFDDIKTSALLSSEMRRIGYCTLSAVKGNSCDSINKINI